MKLASHNSWSYLPPNRWWERLFRFTAKCQDASIAEQYERYGVRCFDLRIRFRNGWPVVVHNRMEYKYTYNDLLSCLEWMNSKGDVALRISLDTRTRHSYTLSCRYLFEVYCAYFEHTYPRIKFWGGENLYNKDVEHKFTYHPTCTELHASVCSPKTIDDWYPRWFAKRNNKKIRKQGTDFDFLMLDFVNY